MRGLRIFEADRVRGLRRAQTDAEGQLRRRLRNRGLGGFKFSRPEPIGPHFADFVCREDTLVVEVDGATHSTDEETAYDDRRTSSLSSMGFRVVRVINDEVYQNLDGVLDTILATMERRLK